jgi:hypothetical protein
MTPEPPPYRYDAFGLAIASALALPELTPRHSAEPADLTIRIAALPAMRQTGVWHCDGAGAGFRVSRVAAYRARAGREITIDPEPGVSERDLRLYLLGTGLGLICHQRGWLPLHASTVVAGGRAVAFAGPTGAGKSTLAAHFDALGYEVMGDDLCVLDLSRGVPSVLPGLSRVKLWADAAARMGVTTTEASRVGDNVAKHHVPLRTAPAARVVPLARLYLLGGARAEFGVARLTGLSAADAVMASIFRLSCLAPMGLTGQAFSLSVATARGLEVFDVRRSLALASFEREAAALERHFAPAGFGAVSA